MPLRKRAGQRPAVAHQPGRQPGAGSWWRPESVITPDRVRSARSVVPEHGRGVHRHRRAKGLGAKVSPLAMRTTARRDLGHGQNSDCSEGFHTTCPRTVAVRADLYWYFDSRTACSHVAGEERRCAHSRRTLARPYYPGRGKATLSSSKPTGCDQTTVRAYALEGDSALGGIYERFIDDIEAVVVAAQRGEVLAWPRRCAPTAVPTTQLPPPR